MGIFDIEKSESSWGGYDFDKKSLAIVVVNDKGEGAVIWGVGGHIRCEIDEYGLSHLDDLGIHPPSAGIWVWEGKYMCYGGSFECPSEGGAELVGKFRKPTDEEMLSVSNGQCPWQDNEWLVPLTGKENANELFRELYDANPTGCCLHVQLDDLNLEDRFFDYSGYKTVEECGNIRHMQLFKILESMTEGERRALVGPRDIECEP